VSGTCAIPSTTGAVRAVLWSVDCNTRDLAHRGYEAITGSQTFQLALTQVLIIYVALVGYRLLFAADGARLSDGPRMALKIGAVLALVSSWSVFETLAFDLAAKAPAEIAALISDGGRTGAQDPIGRLQVAYDQLSSSAAAFTAAATTQNGQQTAPQVTPPTTTSPQDAEQADAMAKREAAGRALGAASAAVLVVDAGLVAVSTLMIGVLGAIGPIFIVLLIFQQTRGFFVGWVRALTAAALVSMSVWLLDLLMTAVLQPWLVALAQQRALKQLEPGAAMTAATIVFVFTAAQLALVAGAGVIAFGFRLVWGQATASAAAPAAGSGGAETAVSPPAMVSRPSLLADQLRRFDGVLEARGRTASGSATGAAFAGVDRVILAGGSTDPYRRAAQARDNLGRRGAFR